MDSTTIFAPGQRVRVLTGRPGTILQATPRHVRRCPRGVPVLLDPWKADFGEGRPRYIQALVFSLPRDLRPL